MEPVAIPALLGLEVSDRFLGDDSDPLLASDDETKGSGRKHAKIEGKFPQGWPESQAVEKLVRRAQPRDKTSSSTGEFSPWGRICPKKTLISQCSL